MNRSLARMRALARRKVRDSSGLFVLEGLRLVADALDAGVHVVEAVYTSDFVGQDAGRRLIERLRASGAGVVEVPRADLERASDTVTPPGVMASGRMPGPEVADAGGLRGAAVGPDIVVVLDRVQDPGNVGAIIRTAASAGASEVCLSPGCADAFGPKSLRASMGAAFRVRIRAVEDCPGLVVGLKSRALKVIGTVASGGSPLYDEDLALPVALLLGNEAQGLDPGLAQVADSLVTIPMAREVESLNVAAAAAVVLFEAVRQRRAAFGCGPAFGCGSRTRVV